MVHVENITYAYPRGAEEVLQQVGFSVEEGECVAVLGNNGAGKSTLLKCIDRICRAQSGSVTVDGADVFRMGGRELARRVAYVPQRIAPAAMSVFDAVLLGRKPYIRWDTTEQDRRVVEDILRQLGLESYALRSMAELSGGEAQKVALARALAQEPRLLLLDEPTSSLDPRNQHEVLRLVRHIARSRRICVVVILHDLNLAVRYCDRFLFLQGSRVYACGGPEVMTPETIQAVYGMRVQIIRHGGVPIVVPFPAETEEGAV